MQSKGFYMKSAIFPAALVLVVALAASLRAEAKGYLKGGAVGGAIGHIAGRHAVLGCPIDHRIASARSRQTSAASGPEHPDPAYNTN